MTKINELVSSPVLSDDDLFVIWFSGSGRTRSVSGKIVRDTLLSKGFNPDAFISGRIDTTDEKLYLTQQRGNEVEIGPVISFMSNHKIEELANVPPLVANNFLKVTPDGSSITYYDLATLKIEELANVGDLEANKLLKVNSAGDAVIYADPFDLSLHKIEELKNVPTLVANKYLRVSPDGTAIEYHDSDISTEKISDLSDVPAIEALKFLRGTADGSATEWIASSSGNEIGVEKGGTALGEVHTLNFDNLFGVAVANDKATITPDGLATKTDLNPLATKAELNKYVLLAPTTKQEVDGLKTVFTTQLISQSTDKSQRFNLNIGNDGTLGGVYGLADGSNDKIWIEADPDAAARLFWNGLKRLETDQYGVINFGHQNKLIYTTGGFALQITSSGQGQLNQTDSKGLQEKIWAQFNRNGSTEFYYNGAKVAETLADGLKVDDHLHVDKYANIGNSAAVESGLNLYTSGGGWGFNEDAAGILTLNQQSASGTIEHAAMTARRNAEIELNYNATKVFETNNDGVTIGNAANKQLLVTTDSTGAFVGFGSKPSIVARENGATELYHNGTKKVETTDQGLQVTTENQDYSQLWVKNTKSGESLIGEFYVGASNKVAGLQLNNKNHIRMHKDDATELYHNGLSTLSTTAKGISINVGEVGAKKNLLWIDGYDSTYGQAKISFGSTNRIQFHTNGENSLIGTWHGSVTPSDANLKNANPIGGLDKLNQLEPLEWTWNNPVQPGGDQGEPVPGQPEAPDQPGDGGDSSPQDRRTHQGFTAQSYQRLFPHLVEEIQPEDIPAGIPNTGSPILGIKKDVTGHEMDALLVDSIQTLNKNITDMNTRIGAIETGVTDGAGLLTAAFENLTKEIQRLDKRIGVLEGSSTNGGSA